MIRILRFLKPYLGTAIFAVVLVIFQSISQLSLPRLMAQIVDEGIANSDTSLILRLGALMLLMSLLGALFAITGSFFSSRTAAAFGRDLRTSLFSTIQDYALADFDELGASTLITRTTNDSSQVQSIVQMGMTMLARAPAMMTVSLVFAIRLNRELFNVLLISLPILIFTIVLVAKVALPLFKKIQERTDSLNLLLRESLAGMRVIRAFTREKYEGERFEKANRDLTQTALKAQRIMMGLMPLITLIMDLTTIGIMAIAARHMEIGQLRAGNLMAFIQYSGQILFSLMMLSSLFVTIPRAQISAGRLNEVLDRPLSLIPPKKPEASSKELYGALSFRNTFFSYAGAEGAALENINIDFIPATVNAIVGSTGAGKSTLLSLALRLHDASGGSVLFNGQDVRKLDLEDLRHRIAYVPQRALLFSGTVRENLLFGDEKANDDWLWHVLDIAQAADFVRALPHGLDSELAQGGRNLSGGQRQRLAIARALVRRAEIYLFDDSFSALDFSTDARLRSALRKELAQRQDAEGRTATVIIVAQRIGTVMDAERIVVLDEGKVVAMGRHKELLSSSAVYREIVESQLTIDETEAPV